MCIYLLWVLFFVDNPSNTLSMKTIYFSYLLLSKLIEHLVSINQCHHSIYSQSPV